MKYYKQESLSVKPDYLLAELMFNREAAAAQSALGRKGHISSKIM